MDLKSLMSGYCSAEEAVQYLGRQGGLTTSSEELSNLIARGELDHREVSGDVEISIGSLDRLLSRLPGTRQAEEVREKAQEINSRIREFHKRRAGQSNSKGKAESSSQEATYLALIGELLKITLSQKGWSQSRIIEEIDGTHRGLSKRNLETIFAKAKKRTQS